MEDLIGLLKELVQNSTARKELIEQKDIINKLYNGLIFVSYSKKNKMLERINNASVSNLTPFVQSFSRAGDNAKNK